MRKEERRQNSRVSLLTSTSLPPFSPSSLGSKTSSHSFVPFCKEPRSGVSSCCTKTIISTGAVFFDTTILAASRILVVALTTRSACGISVSGKPANDFWMSITKRAVPVAFWDVFAGAEVVAAVVMVPVVGSAILRAADCLVG